MYRVLLLRHSLWDLQHPLRRRVDAAKLFSPPTISLLPYTHAGVLRSFIPFILRVYFPSTSFLAASILFLPPSLNCHNTVYRNKNLHTSLSHYHHTDRFRVLYQLLLSPPLLFTSSNRICFSLFSFTSSFLQIEFDLQARFFPHLFKNACLYACFM